jgi:hypothetical protein
MYRDLFSVTELAAAAVLIAVAGYAALALGHGNYQTAVIVEIAMVAGLTNIVRTRDLERQGRRTTVGQNWLAARWFAFAVLILIFAPKL